MQILILKFLLHHFATNKSYQDLMFPSHDKHHHHHGHHHGHHDHHHKDNKIVVVVEKPHIDPVQGLINIGLNQALKATLNSNQGFNNQGFNNQGFNTNQGFNNMGQGFNTNPINMNQGFNPNPMNLFNPYQEGRPQYGIRCLQKKNNYGQLIIYKKTGKLNQRFRIVQENNRYLIVSCSATNVLTVLNNSSEKGQHIHTHYNANENGQLWQFSFVKDSPNTFYIHNGHNLYLDVFKERHSEGTPIIQWKFKGKKNQIWKIVPAS